MKQEIKFANVLALTLLINLFWACFIYVDKQDITQITVAIAYLNALLICKLWELSILHSQEKL
jgi:hypothetical protein